MSATRKSRYCGLMKVDEPAVIHSTAFVELIQQLGQSRSQTSAPLVLSEDLLTIALGCVVKVLALIMATFESHI